jgi:hypothetical protein
MGFSLVLDDLIGKYVKITIEEVDSKGYTRLWKTDKEKYLNEIN